MHLGRLGCVVLPEREDRLQTPTVQIASTNRGKQTILEPVRSAHDAIEFAALVAVARANITAGISRSTWTPSIRLALTGHSRAGRCGVSVESAAASAAARVSPTRTPCR